MGILTGSKHGDQANSLLAFYQDQANKLEDAGLYFMAAIALGAALETALLTYMLVEWGEDNGGELKIPGDVSLNALIDAAHKFELLTAIKFKESELSVSHPVETVIREIQSMRNNLHPARVLRNSFDPASFDNARYQRLKNIYLTIIDNLLHNL